MAIDKEEFPSYPPSVADIAALEVAFEAHKSFKDGRPENAVAQLEWQQTKAQAEILILLHNLGLKPVQTLVIMDALIDHQEEINHFVRAGLELSESDCGTPHPIAMPLAESIANASDDLQEYLNERDAQLLFDEGFRRMDLAAMPDEDILHDIDGMYP
jgi:hypothetical protein